MERDQGRQLLDQDPRGVRKRLYMDGNITVCETECIQTKMTADSNSGDVEVRNWGS